MKIIICSYLIIISHILQGSEEQYPNFDNRLEIAKIIDEAVVGVWDEFDNKSLPFDEFRQKNGLQFERSSSYPYSGFYVQLDSKKRIRNLRTFSSGLLEGPSISWRENGLKFFEGHYKGGKKDGIFIYWSKKSSKISQQTYLNGKLDGLTVKWYLNGQMSSEQIFQNGKIISAIGWKPNGERCPLTRVVDGVGVLVVYDDFGEISLKKQHSDLDQEIVVEKYENGNTREEGFYKDGKKHGVWTYYRPDGVKQFQVTYRDGQRLTTKFLSPL